MTHLLPLDQKNRARHGNDLQQKWFPTEYEFQACALGEAVKDVGGRTVLIVEDEWLIRMELAAAFEDEGYSVLESASGEDAVASLGQGYAVDLLVTDIRLTGPMTGWDVAAEARLRDPAIGVIYVSANPPAPGRDVNGSIFIDKPAMIGQVLDAARRLLEQQSRPGLRFDGREP
jgi:CheY-like chemotaxis protein